MACLQSLEIGRRLELILRAFPDKEIRSWVSLVPRPDRRPFEGMVGEGQRRGCQVKTLLTEFQDKLATIIDAPFAKRERPSVPLANQKPHAITV